MVATLTRAPYLSDSKQTLYEHYPGKHPSMNRRLRLIMMINEVNFLHLK